jgi:hypothetical protein
MIPHSALVYKQPFGILPKTILIANPCVVSMAVGKLMFPLEAASELLLASLIAAIVRKHGTRQGGDAERRQVGSHTACTRVLLQTLGLARVQREGTNMPRPRRWRRARVAGAVLLVLAALPVTARPEGGRSTPPLRVAVAAGDTIWSLALERGDPHRDVRDVVTVMLRANRVNPGDLQPGQVLIIPAAYAADGRDGRVLAP